MAETKLPPPTVGRIWPPSPILHEPAPTDKLWRYMDFVKLVSILDSKSLFLPNSTVFTDKWEGSYPKRDSFIPENHPALSNDQLASLIKNRTEFRKHCFISCWHISSHESAAMWELYRNGDFGIAIQTSYERLKQSLGDLKTCRPIAHICLTKVNYIDYETETFEGRVAEVDITPFFHKRKSFEHEKEFRIIIRPYHQIPPFIELPVDLNLLLENIYISPMAPNWFKNLVVNILIKYNFPNTNVHHSKLEQDPIF